MVEKKEISRPNGKLLFEKVCNGEKDARKLADKLQMLDGLSDSGINKLIDSLIDRNKSAIEDYKITPDKIVNFFIGQLMRETKGRVKIDKARSLIVSKMDVLSK